MDTCARCNRPIDTDKGFFIDHNSGVTMHSLCFLGAGPKPLREPVRLPVAVPAEDRRSSSCARFRGNRT